MIDHRNGLNICNAEGEFSIVVVIPEEARKYGFVVDPVGTHGSRTMMLSELSQLFDACPMSASYDDLRTAIVDENVLGKRSLTTRKESFRRLRELYGLTADLPLFTVLRQVWSVDPDAQPLLALLCATARDPLLRATADLILDTPEGVIVTPHQVAEAAARGFPDRYNPTMIANIGRNAASTWKQSGHLIGHQKKRRTWAIARPMAAVYAACLAYLCGARGDLILSSFWLRLLDTPEATIRSLLDQAARQGYLLYRSGGGITEISFPALLADVAVDS